LSHSFAREEGNEKLSKKIGDEMVKFQQILSGEKQQREDIQAKMFRMLEEMNSRLNFAVAVSLH